MAWPMAPLAPSLARELGTEALALDVRHFPDGESLVRLPCDVAGDDVVLAASFERPDAKFLPLAFAADAARELGARRVLLVSPYLPYMRQDVRFRDGEAVSSRTFARLVSSTFDGVVTVDPHLHRWHALSDIYTVPTQVVASAPAIAQWIAANVASPLIVGPDSESEQWVAEVAKLASAPWAVMEKQRHGDRDVTVALRCGVPGGSHTPVLVDDIVSSGATIVAAAGVVQRQAGLAAPVVVAVHALFDDAGLATMRAAGVTRIASCDTVPHPTNAIPVGGPLARAVRALLP